MKLALAPLAALFGFLAACAPYGPPAPGPMAAAPMSAPPAGPCFRTSEIRNHTIGDDQTLYLNVNGRDVYRVAMSGSCLAGAVSSDPLVLRQPPGSPLVCRPIDLDVAVSRGGLSAIPCIVNSIHRLAPDEVAALPPRLRP